MICGEPRTDELFQLSDRICTALQLTNHWQDVRRDILERDRIYLPAEIVNRVLGPSPAPLEGETTGHGESVDRHAAFESRLIASAKQGWGVDQAILDESRKVIRACVEQTWSLYDEGLQILDRLGPTSRPIVWLLAAGGQRVLRLIEMWNYETALNRPRLSKPAKLSLVAQAWWMSVRGRRRAVNPPSPGMVEA
jgi:phytoene/squalene synthetase